MKAATALVREHGVAGTSLDAVIAASATSKSQLYHYFADKDALVVEVVRGQLELIIAGQRDQLRELDSWAGLHRWRDHLVAGTAEAGGVGGCPLGSLVGELAERSDAARRQLADCFATWTGHLAAGLAGLQAKGRLRPGADPDELALTVMAALQGGLLLAQTERSVRPLELALDMALEHLERQRVTLARPNAVPASARPRPPVDSAAGKFSAQRGR